MAGEPRESIKWYSEFANLNLNKLNPGDKAKLVVESEEYLFPSLKGLKRKLQSHFKSHVWFLKKYPQRDSREYWSLLLHLQEVVRQELRRLTTPGRREFFSIVPTLLYISPKENILFMPLGHNIDEFIQWNINFGLSAYPYSVLQKCLGPKCGKYFVNFSRRKKRFCSARCIWRFNSAERRKKLSPEKYKEYLEKQKKLMRKTRKRLKGPLE